MEYPWVDLVGFFLHLHSMDFNQVFPLGFSNIFICFIIDLVGSFSFILLFFDSHEFLLDLNKSKYLAKIKVKLFKLKFFFYLIENKNI